MNSYEQKLKYINEQIDKTFNPDDSISLQVQIRKNDVTLIAAYAKLLDITIEQLATLFICMELDGVKADLAIIDTQRKTMFN